MATPTHSTKIAARMIISTVDVIHLRGGAYAHTLESQFADPVCVPQHRQAYLLPVFWQSVSSAG
jgi:hypothetical protein